MTLYRKEKDNCYIHIVLINANKRVVGPSDASKEIISTSDANRISIPPCGNPGYNVIFSTDCGLIEIMDKFYPFFNPESKFSADDDKIGYLTKKLSQISKEDIIRLSCIDEMWVGIHQEKDNLFC